MSFLDRIGAAIVDPRRALATADRERKASGDTLVLLGLKVLCADLPALVAATMTFLLIGAGAGLQALLHALDEALRTDIVILVGALLVITVGAGRRRDWARDVELAAVAWIPALVVGLAGSGIALVTGPVTWLRRGAGIAAAIWVLALCIPAIRLARRREVTP
jgi:uncharacterized membrane protein YphA (DoxX/SURF4 family)